jgi:hypothetical protein
VLLPARQPPPPAKADASGGGGGKVATAVLCAAAVYAVVRMSDPPPSRAAPPLPPNIARMVEGLRPTAEQMQRRWGVPAAVLLSDAALCAATNEGEIIGNDCFCRGRAYKSAWAAFNAYAKALSEKLPERGDGQDPERFIEAAKQKGLFLRGGEERLRAMLPRVERTTHQP